MGLLVAAMLLVVTVQNAPAVPDRLGSHVAGLLLPGGPRASRRRKCAGPGFIIWSPCRSGRPSCRGLRLGFEPFGQPGLRRLRSGPRRSRRLVPVALFLLFFVGFGTKAGFVPLHTWLPLAHPAAPTGVSALMSGVMIKTGIYGILRVLLLGGGPDRGLAYVVLIVALVSGVFGVMNAIAQHDLKKLLAYHSIENIGIIGTRHRAGHARDSRPARRASPSSGSSARSCTSSTISPSRACCSTGPVSSTRKTQHPGHRQAGRPGPGSPGHLGPLPVRLAGHLRPAPLQRLHQRIRHLLRAGPGLGRRRDPAPGPALRVWPGWLSSASWPCSASPRFSASPSWDRPVFPIGSRSTEGSVWLLAPMAVLAVLIVAVGLLAPLVVPLLGPVVRLSSPAERAAEWPAPRRPLPPDRPGAGRFRRVDPLLRRPPPPAAREEAGRRVQNLGLRLSGREPALPIHGQLVCRAVPEADRAPRPPRASISSPPTACSPRRLL